MVVPQTGYSRVLQAYTAEGMSRVRVRVRLGGLHTPCTTYECIVRNVSALLT